MVIFTSDLPNDQDMIKALGSCAIPVPLPCGDCAFFGVSDSSEHLRICVERKKLGDLAQCINDGRYLAQAITAKEAGFDILCLIVEGESRSSPEDGLLETPVWGINPNTLKRAEIWQPVKPTITYSRFDQYLTELDYLVGIVVKRSRDVHETASIIKALWDNFQTPPSQHNSLHQIFTPSPERVQLVRPNLVRRVAKELPGIGWDRSGEVARHFASVKEMVEADVKEWQTIEGIGKKLAAGAVNALRGVKQNESDKQRGETGGNQEG